MINKKILLLILFSSILMLNAVSAQDNNITIDAPELEKFYGGNERFTVNVYENNEHIESGNVQYTINGVEYNRNIVNGSSSIAINLNSGYYQVTTKYKNTEVQSRVYVYHTIGSSDLVKTYKNDSQYYATFIDTSGVLLKNTPVKFNINGVFYTRTTNENGIAKLNINLAPGKYIITCINPINKEQASNIVTVLSNIESADLVMAYKDGSKFEAKILGGNGKPVGAGESVTFNINGVFYTRTTDSDGVARLNINLRGGTYIITTITSNGGMSSNIININYDFWHLPDSEDPNPEVARMNLGDGIVRQLYNDNYERFVNLNTLEIEGYFGFFIPEGIIMVADDGRYYYYDNGDFAYHGENYDEFYYYYY